MKKRLFIFLLAILFIIAIVFFFIGPTGIANLLPLLPPIIAMGLAFITYSVEISLFIGIMSGAVISINDTFFNSLLYSPFKVVDHYVVTSLASSGHISIIIFTIFIGGLVSLIGYSGGMIGLVNYLSKFAKSAVSAQMITWVMGLLVFFDGCANTFIVGNTARPLCDKYRVSREKLSFIVDSTSSPVTSLVIISTWIGYEIGLIGEAYKVSGILLDPYLSFIYSLPYRFYVILILIFIPILILMKRDMFTMATAEQRARRDGTLLRPGSIPMQQDEEFHGKEHQKPNPLNAIIPIAILLIGVVLGIVITGMVTVNSKGGEYNLISILEGSDSFKGLIWASFVASITAGTMIVFQKIGTIKEVIEIWLKGIKSMIPAVIILTLAWSMSAVLKDIETAKCIATFVGDSIPIWSLPIIIFLASSLISFATGTSWGTMAIMFPIAIPLVISITNGQGITELHQIEQTLYPVIGSILSGAVFGDHCSPISDTTILSSIASGASHIDHVKTQLPYTLLIGILSSTVGYIPIGFGLNPVISLTMGIFLMFIILLIFGKKIVMTKNKVNRQL